MSGKFFLDTNILVYAYSGSDPLKSQVARSLNRPADGYVSTQVLTELANVLARKLKIAWPDIKAVINNIAANFPVHLNSPTTIAKATELAGRYSFSWYDSLIVSAALECGCDTLYSEDLQHGLLVDQKLKIVNPFLP